MNRSLFFKSKVLFLDYLFKFPFHDDSVHLWFLKHRKSQLQTFLFFFLCLNSFACQKHIISMYLLHINTINTSGSFCRVFFCLRQPFWNLQMFPYYVAVTRGKDRQRWIRLEGPGIAVQKYAATHGEIKRRKPRWRSLIKVVNVGSSGRRQMVSWTVAINVFCCLNMLLSWKIKIPFLVSIGKIISNIFYNRERASNF